MHPLAPSPQHPDHTGSGGSTHAKPVQPAITASRPVQVQRAARIAASFRKAGASVVKGARNGTKQSRFADPSVPGRGPTPIGLPHVGPQKGACNHEQQSHLLPGCPQPPGLHHGSGPRHRPPVGSTSLVRLPIRLDHRWGVRRRGHPRGAGLPPPSGTDLGNRRGAAGWTSLRCRCSTASPEACSTCLPSSMPRPTKVWASPPSETRGWTPHLRQVASSFSSWAPSQSLSGASSGSGHVGMARARCRGTALGRRKVSVDLRPDVAMLHVGHGLKATAGALRVDVAAPKRQLKEAGHWPRPRSEKPGEESNPTSH